MRFATPSFLFVLVGALAGCGGSPQALPPPSHDGAMFELPGGKGFFEIKTEEEATTSRGSKSKTGPTNTILVYFYQPDRTTEMSPAPTDVTVKVGFGPESPAVPLSPRAKGADSPSGFASTPGPYPSGFRGQLSAKIGGEAVEAPFLFR
jgi:hypothetical protein